MSSYLITVLSKLMSTSKIPSREVPRIYVDRRGALNFNVDSNRVES